MSVKCYFCDKDAMGDTENLDPPICMDCAIDEERCHVARKVWESRMALNDALKALVILKNKDVPRYIARVFISSSGLTTVFTQFNEPMPEYQGQWKDVHDKLLPVVEEQEIKPMLSDNFNVGWMIR